MNPFRSIGAATVFGLSALALAPSANAQGSIPYPNSGTPNPDAYSFSAASDGDLIAYFAGSAAGYDNQLGVLVNGVAQGGFGLDDHTSLVGDAFNFGHVKAGDSLVFILHNVSLGMDAYSDPSLNGSYDDPSDTLGHQHVYSTSYIPNTPGQDVFAGVPAGTYIAFEDIPFPSSDFNYFDENFVFGNVVNGPAAVPEPGVMALLLGIGTSGIAMNRRRRSR